jgi:hypothetical protein
MTSEPAPREISLGASDASSAIQYSIGSRKTVRVRTYDRTAKHILNICGDCCACAICSLGKIEQTIGDEFLALGTTANSRNDGQYADFCNFVYKQFPDIKMKRK